MKNTYLKAAAVAVAALGVAASTALAGDFKAAGCLVFKKDSDNIPTHVLVAKNRFGELAFVMARPSHDESDPRQTAARAAKEEAGLDVEVKENIALGSAWEQRNAGKSLFVCEPKAGTDMSKLKPEDSNRVKGLVWLDPHTMQDEKGEALPAFRGGYDDQRVLIDIGLIP